MNMRAIRPLLAGLLMVASAALVQAQSPPQPQAPVYRCGAEGREYSSTPCPGGKTVDVGDARSIDQRRAAQDAARREAALAQRLAAERRQREASVKGGAARIGPAAAASAPAKAASRPATHKHRKKARKAKDPNMSEPIRVPKPVR